MKHILSIKVDDIASYDADTMQNFLENLKDILGDEYNIIVSPFSITCPTNEDIVEEINVLFKILTPESRLECLHELLDAFSKN